MEEARREELRVAAVGVGAVAAILAGSWVFDALALRLGIPPPFEDRLALSPLYAFCIPLARPQSIGFVALALAFVLGAARACDPERTPRPRFALGLLAAAVLLPLGLFLVREEPGGLGSQFNIYANEEFYHDALRIQGLGSFLEHYVERMPLLSLHGRHFPPGHAVLLHLVVKLFGPGTLPAGVAVLACFAGAVVLAWLAIERVAGAKAARQGACLLLASPSLLDFACTSMDAVFLLFATAAWLLALRAFSPRGSTGSAFAAGASLLLAASFSFSALPVGLAIGLHALWSGRNGPRTAAVRLAGFASGFALAALALDAATGFSLLDCFRAARASASEFMAHAFGADPGTLWAPISFGNAVAFAIGSGLALLAALLARLRVGGLGSDPWAPAALAAIAVMALSGIYTLETERVWLFAMPWIAAVAVSSKPFEDGSLRMLLSAGLLQALAMETLLFTLW